MSRISLRGIDTTGADATNDTPRYNPATDRLEYAPGGTSSGGSSTGVILLDGGATVPTGTDPGQVVFKKTASGTGAAAVPMVLIDTGGTPPTSTAVGAIIAEKG